MQALRLGCGGRVAYRSIQEAIDRNPGKPVFVPAGDHVISTALRIRGNGGGLWGPGRIIQSNPEEGIVDVRDGTDVQLRDLTLTRPEGKWETHRPGVFVLNCSEVALINLRVLDNRGDLASVYVKSSSGVRIKDCLIQNYSRISIDDRTRRPEHPDFDIVGGYAFHVITGTGIGIRACQGVLIQNNRVIERVMLPTPELKAKHKLGSFSTKEARKGSGLTQEFWDSNYYNAWHQGSAIAVASIDTDPLVNTNPFVEKEAPPQLQPGMDHHFQLIGNYIENAAQGMDIHVDNAIVANNIVTNAFMGMKAVHGARNVLIIGNQFRRADLWAILLGPGTASHRGRLAADGKPERAPNIDGQTIVANNIISDFGYGQSRWIWKDADPTPFFLNNDKKTPTTPPLRGLIVQGNIIYDTGSDQILGNGQLKKEPPRYRYAVKINSGAGEPQDVIWSSNLFAPGTEGVSNVPLGK
jgi:hypothetical protein